MTVREEIAAKENLLESIAESTSLMEVLRKIGIPDTQYNGRKLQALCKSKGISLEHLAPKEHESITSTCPECGKNFPNKSGGNKAKTWCTTMCANLATARTRDQEALCAKAAITRSLKPKVKRGHADVTLLCANCHVSFTRKWIYREKIFCSKTCCGQFQGKKFGRDSGRKSAQKMVRRSKNEILFSEMCAERWAIVCNEPMFDGWDADVVIPDLKVAVLWNGIWHYKEGIRPGHSLLQVQTRDQIKLKVIEKYGYRSYVIRDMGKHNPKFVKEEFEKFVEWCKSLSEVFRC